MPQRPLKKKKKLAKFLTKAQKYSKVDFIQEDQCHIQDSWHYEDIIVVTCIASSSSTCFTQLPPMSGYDAL